MDRSLDPSDRFRRYDICREQSRCYLLTPPPRLPRFPEWIMTNTSITSTNARETTDVYFILLGILISLISICFLLMLFIAKFRVYRKVPQSHHQPKETHIVNECASLPSIFPTSYNSCTPITLITNRSPSLMTMNKSNSTHQSHSSSNNRLSLSNRSMNTYEIVRSAGNHQYCSCCSCALAHYENTRCLSSSRQLSAYYYSYASPEIAWSHSASRNQRCEQHCPCQNFFVPIK